MKKYYFKSENGFTISELAASMLISVIVTVGAIWAIIAFFNKYEEYRLRTYLYQEAFNTLDTIKYGLPLGSGSETYFYGVASANELRITRGFSSAEGRGVRVVPSIQQGGYFDFSEYYLDDGKIKGTYLYQSVGPPSPIILFPGKYDNRIFVTNFSVTMLNQANTAIYQLNPARLIEIVLEAELRYKGKVFPVRYKTAMTTIINKQENTESDNSGANE